MLGAVQGSGRELWSASDATLPLPPLLAPCSPDYAQRFIDTLPDARLVWVDECGHCAHLEQPQALADEVARFVGAAALADAAAA